MIVAVPPVPVPGRTFPRRREVFLGYRETVAPGSVFGMLGGIEITVPSFSTRHATTIALAVLLCSARAAGLGGPEGAAAGEGSLRRW